MKNPQLTTHYIRHYYNYKKCSEVCARTFFEYSPWTVAKSQNGNVVTWWASAHYNKAGSHSSNEDKTAGFAAVSVVSFFFIYVAFVVVAFFHFGALFGNCTWIAGRAVWERGKYVCVRDWLLTGHDLIQTKERVIKERRTCLQSASDRHNRRFLTGRQNRT